MPVIRIRHYEFSVADPYSAGHVLDENEAAALNALRAENIRNNLRRHIERLLDSTGRARSDVLPPAEVAAVIAHAAEYDASYSFGPRAPSPPRNYGTLNGEARSIARARILEEARASAAELSEQEIDRRIADLLRSDDSIFTLARRRVEARERIALEGLEGLALPSEAAS